MRFGDCESVSSVYVVIVVILIFIDGDRLNL